MDRVAVKLEQGLVADRPGATVKSKQSCDRWSNKATWWHEVDYIIQGRSSQVWFVSIVKWLDEGLRRNFMLWAFSIIYWCVPIYNIFEYYGIKEIKFAHFLISFARSWMRRRLNLPKPILYSNITFCVRSLEVWVCCWQFIMWWAVTERFNKLIYLIFVDACLWSIKSNCAVSKSYQQYCCICGLRYHFAANGLDVSVLIKSVVAKYLLLQVTLV